MKKGKKTGAWVLSKEKHFFVIAHNIRSLENVGAVFRTADAFGVSKLFLTGYTGSPPNEKISKSALGAEEYVVWQKVFSPVRLIKKLRLEYPKLQVVSLENNVPFRKTRLLQKFKPSFPVALILGTETTGIPKALMDLSDVVVEIPMFGKKESLNVSVAFGVAAFQLSAGMMEAD